MVIAIHAFFLNMSVWLVFIGESWSEFSSKVSTFFDYMAMTGPG